MWRYHETKGWSLEPNTTGEVSIDGGSEHVTIRINSDGLRSPEPPPIGQGLQPLVVVVGDSFVFGLGVGEDRLLTSVLERLLQASFRNARVVNMAVSGYSTDQELLLFRELGGRYRPSVVVLMMCDNDFVGNLEDFAYLAYYKPYFTTSKSGLELHNVPVPRLTVVQRSKLWLGRHSILWNAARSRRSPSALGQAVLDQLQVATPRKTTEDPVRLTAQLVLQMRTESERLGARFLVTNTAHRGERLDHFTPLRRRYLRPAGVRFIRMEDYLEPARLAHPDHRWDFGRNTHWNVDSHAFVATILARELVALLSEVAPGAGQLVP